MECNCSPSCQEQNNSKFSNFQSATKQYPVPATITTDAHGMRTVTAGSLVDLAQGIGYVYALDFLWYTTLFNLTAAGKLSTVFGEDYLEADIMTLNVSYTDEEIEEQISTYVTPFARSIMEACIKGFNARVREVMDNPTLLPAEFTLFKVPLQEYTLGDMGRGMTYFGTLFSGMFLNSFAYQLTNQSYLEGLLEKYPMDTAMEILNDIIPPLDVSRFSWDILAEGCLRHINPSIPLIECPKGISTGANGNTYAPNKRSLEKNGHIGLSKGYAKNFLDKLLRIKGKLTKLGIATKWGSNSTVIGGKRTSTGNPITTYAPQGGVGNPPTIIGIIGKCPELEGLFVLLNGLLFFVTNGCMYNPMTNYYFTGVLTDNFMISCDAMYDSKSNAYLLRTVTREIPTPSGPKVVEIPIYRDKNSAFVMEYDVPGMPDMVLCLRTMFLGKEYAVFNIINGFLISSPQSLTYYYTSYMLGDYWGYNFNGMDSYGNIYNVLFGNMQRLPSSVDRRLPQGIFNNPILPTSDYQAMPMMISWDTPDNFYVNWNAPYIQGLPYCYGIAEYHRREWIERYVKYHSNFTIDNIEDLQVWIGTANDMEGGQNWYPLPKFTDFSISQGYDSDLFTQYFADLFLSVVTNSQTKSLLASYNGQYVTGDLNDLINSPTINPQWVLANSWCAQYIKLLLNMVFEGTDVEVIIDKTYPYVYTLSNITFSTPTPYNGLKSLVVRLTGLGRCKVPLYYDWLQGRSIESLIQQAHDLALEALGGYENYPWPVASQRPKAAITSLVLGTLYEEYVLNRATLYLAAQMTEQGLLIKYVQSGGFTGNIYLVDGKPVPSPNFGKEIIAHQTYSLFTITALLHPGKPVPCNVPTLHFCCRKGINGYGNVEVLENINIVPNPNDVSVYVGPFPNI